MGRPKKTSESERKKVLESYIENLQLLIEDADFRKVAANIFGEDADKQGMKDAAKRSKESYHKYPSYKHIVELNKSFVLGSTGFQRPISNNPLIQYIIDFIYDSKENRRTFSSYIAQEKIQEQKDLTGEIFFKIYIHKKTGECIIRLEKDTSRIQEVVTLEGDSDYIVYYKYQESRKKYDPKEGKYTEEKTGTLYIQDILCSDEDAETISVKPAEKDDVKLYGYLVSFGNPASKSLRGWPIYYSVIKYLHAHKGVAEDAATILKALSTFAWKKKYKNNLSKPQLDGLRRLAETMTSDLNLNKTKPATGATLFETDQVDNTPIEIKHNAGAFWDTSRILMQQISAGSQKMEHYFGNPANANLATATSMELPMLKDFERQQAELGQVIEEVMKFAVLKVISIHGVNYIMAKAKEKGYDIPTDPDAKAKIVNDIKTLVYETLNLSIIPPEILVKQTLSMIQSIVFAYNAGLISDKDAAATIYAILGYNNVDDKISELFGDYGEGLLSAGNDVDAKSELEKILKTLGDANNTDNADKDKDREPKGSKGDADEK